MSRHRMGDALGRTVRPFGMAAHRHGRRALPVERRRSSALPAVDDRYVRPVVEASSKTHLTRKRKRDLAHHVHAERGHRADGGRDGRAVRDGVERSAWSGQVGDALHLADDVRLKLKPVTERLRQHQ